MLGKKGLYVVLCFLVVVGSFGVQSQAKEPIVMKIGHNSPVEIPRHQSLLIFKQLVEERTNGGIKVEISWWTIRE